MAEMESRSDLNIDSIPSHDVTPRKKAARRQPFPQDDQPHHAVARTGNERLAKALALVCKCAEIADDNRAKNILVLDLRQATPLLDFFLIATASTRRLANAIAIETDVEMKRLQEHKLGTGWKRYASTASRGTKHRLRHACRPAPFAGANGDFGR